LVIAAESGHDPLKATGLVLSHLPQICKRSTPDAAQIWTLRATSKPHEDPWTYLQKIAKQENKAPATLFAESRLSPQQLAADPLRKRAR
jgi:hypothetical protein